MSAVSVLVIDWTTIGAPPPTVTAPSPSPTVTPTVRWRGAGPAISGPPPASGLSAGISERVASMTSIVDFRGRASRVPEP